MPTNSNPTFVWIPLQVAPMVVQVAAVELFLRFQQVRLYNPVKSVPV